MNIIFLDVDGVLNSIKKLKLEYYKTYKPYFCNLYSFDEVCLENLKILVDTTDSKLVISSTWRKDEVDMEILMNELKKYDLDDKVIGCTPILGTERGIEIKEYLSPLDEEVNFIILDDRSDMGKLLPYLVKTDKTVGLTYQDVQEGIKKLRKQY